MKRCILVSLTFLLFFSFAFAQNDKWNIAKSTHFIVHYQHAPEDFIEDLIEKAEEYYDKIAEDLGFRRYNFWLWDNRAKIQIYDDAASYQKSTGLPVWSAGAVIPKDKVISTFSNKEGFLTTVLPHEMGHIIFREFVGFDNAAIPLWLDEGVASYQEVSQRSIANRIVRKAISDGTFIDLEKLFSFNPRLALDSQLVNLFYAESLSIIDYLIGEFGKDNFVLFCQKLRDKKDLLAAINYTYSFRSIREMGEAWQEYLENE